MTSMQNDLKAFEILAQTFAEKELAPRVSAHDRYPFGDFFLPSVEKAFEAGLMSVVLPEALGGAGAGIAALCAVLKAISRVDASMGGIIYTQALVQELVNATGAGKALEDLFHGMSRTEDLTAFQLYSNHAAADNLPGAVASGGAYLLSGRLTMLVLGGVARRAVVPARVGAEGGLTFFLIDLKNRGVAKSPPIMTLGLHACPAVDITLEDTAAQIIGEEGQGGRYFDDISGRLHAAAGAINVGIMEGALSEALIYARERFQGGRAIIGWSEIAMMLADMSMKTEAAVLCLEQSCRILEKGGDNASRRSLAAALHIHELACGVVTDGIQVLGGYGYMKDYGQEKRYRDARHVQALLGSAPVKKLSLIKEEVL